MRRLLLVCLLVMLPLQGLWAAVAGIAALDTPCAASQQGAAHASSADAADPPHDDLAGVAADCEAAAGGPCGDSGCTCCHGHTLVALISVPVVPGACPGTALVPRIAGGTPDHIPDQPLRPPLRHAG